MNPPHAVQPPLHVHVVRRHPDNPPWGGGLSVLAR
jgi:hypothetical protein